MNYVDRDAVDGAFIESLARDKHIVVFGSSKQGKTSLRKWNLKPDDYVTVTCSNRWQLRDVHSAILKSAGYETEVSTTRTAGGEAKIRATLSGKLKSPIAEFGAEVGAEDNTSDTVARTTKAIELDPEDVNDIIAALTQAGFERFLVLEDFHYLPEETQQDFAFALKAFHESSALCFIIVGVWLDENRLIQLNGDLAGRVLAIDADAWASDELRAVVDRGAELLNVEFDSNFVDDLLASCFDSVWIVQECCYRLCDASQVFHSDHAIQCIGADTDASVIAKEVVATQSARYNTFLSAFADGFMATSLEMYRWLLLPIILSDPVELEHGLLYAEISRMIDKYHPSRPINAGNLTQALKSTASLQSKLNLKPLVIDYNQSRRRLDVVDRSFLIWLQHQAKDELLSICGLPSSIVGG